MVNETVFVAFATADFKRNPNKYRFSYKDHVNSTKMMHPTDTGTVDDVINAKIVELGLKNWQLIDEDTRESKLLAQMSWDWYSKLSLDQFSED